MNIRQKKKFLKASAALAVVTSAIIVPAQVQASSFSDLVPSQYFYDDVMNLQERGIINGFSDGTFKPNASLTRGQAAKMIAGVLKLDTVNVVDPNFTDINTTHQYYGVIAALKQAGIIDGYTDGTFKPGETMQRNHVAKILANALKLKAKDVENLPFTDINASYKEAIAALYENNVTTGKTTTTFDGKAFVTRGQMAAFIARAEKAAKPTETQTKAISGVITNVTANEITIDNNTYTIPATLKSILNKENAQALANAKIEATVNGTELMVMNALTIVAAGTKEAPIVLQGVVQPVASTTPVNGAIDFAGTLHIQAPYVQLKNMNIAKLNVAKEVAELTIEGKVNELTVLADAAPKLLGKATIDKLTVASQKPVAIETTGTIATLTIEQKSAAVTLGKEALVAALATTAENANAVISNFEAIRQNVTTVNGQAVKPVVPQIIIGESSTPAKVEKTGVITASNNSALTIDGKEYAIDKSLERLFVGNPLVGSEITVVVEKNKITQINALTIHTDGAVLESTATIHGNVVVNADNVVLAGLTIAGDVQLTEQVQSAINFEETTIQGKLKTVEDQPQVARAKARMFVASTGPIAAETKTRLKITFTNSTVAYIEIKKEDTALSMYGATTISVISVESNNSSVFADSEVVLPTVKISKGATKIVLNASIASVEITSTSSVEVTGTGNFDKVKVDVPKDKPVILKTEGTIKEIATSENAGIELGTTVKVGKMTDFEGVAKPAKEVVKNYEEVKANVNVEINDEELEDYIFAKAIPVKDRFGYATLHVQNADNNTVKYRLVEWGAPLVSVGQPVPADAITYNKGDEFISWGVNQIEVYKVDEAGIIVDAFKADSWLHYGPEQTIQVQDGKLILKSNYAPIEYISLKGAIFVNNGQFLNIETSTKEQWTVDADGIPTYTMELPKDFSYDATKEAQLQYTIFGKAREMTDGKSINAYDQDRMTDVVGLNGLVNLSDLNKNGKKLYIEQLLSNGAYEEVKVKDEENGFENTKRETVFNRHLLDKYIEAIRTTPLTAYNEIKALVVRVNGENTAYLAAIKQAEQAVVALYKKDHYDYEYYERLADDITLEEIEAAEKLVNALNDSEQRLEVTNELNAAKHIYNEISKIFTLQTTAKEFLQSNNKEQDATNYWNLRSEIQDTLNRYVYTVANNGNHVLVANTALLDKYAEKLALQPVKTITELKKLVETVNAANTEFLTKYAQAMNTVKALFVPNYNNVANHEYLTAGVTAEQVAQAEKMVNELGDTIQNTELSNLMYQIKDIYVANEAVTVAKQTAEAYLKAVAENESQQYTLRDKLNVLLKNADNLNWRLFDEYVKQLATTEISTRQQLSTLVAEVNTRFADDLANYEEVESMLQALFSKDAHGNYSVDTLSPDFTVAQFVAAKQAIKKFEEQTTLTNNFEGRYMSQARYLFEATTSRPAQLMQTSVMPKEDASTELTFTFSEAVQGEAISADFIGVDATNTKVEVADKTIIITTSLTNEILPAVTINGVQDADGNAIQLKEIPVVHWTKE